MTITGILPVRAGSLGRCGAGGAAAEAFGLPLAALDELPDAFGFFVGQTRQRRPFAWEAGVRADVDQLFAVKFQLFRECVNANRQV